MSGFFCSSDFTWNQSLGFQQKCHFGIFEALKIDLEDFLELSETAKTAVFELIESSKLISRKMWVAGKNYVEILTIFMPFSGFKKRQSKMSEHESVAEEFENEENEVPAP